MPTYDYSCEVCGSEASVVQSMGDYCRSPQRPSCCAREMVRRLTVNPLMTGIQNALAGDNHYRGLAATDGTPIDTRTKHRQYMKDNGLAMDTDFKQTWRKAAAERELRRAGEYRDPETRAIVTELVQRAVAEPS